jgi:hypothetical protein
MRREALQGQVEMQQRFVPRPRRLTSRGRGSQERVVVDDELQRVVRQRETRGQLGIPELGGGKLAAKLRCEFQVPVVQLGSSKRCRISISSDDRVQCGGAGQLSLC